MRDKNGVGGLYNLFILRPSVIGLCEFENLPSDNIVGTGEMTRQVKAFVFASLTLWVPSLVSCDNRKWTPQDCLLTSACVSWLVRPAPPPIYTQTLEQITSQNIIVCRLCGLPLERHSRVQKGSKAYVNGIDGIHRDQSWINKKIRADHQWLWTLSECICDLAPATTVTAWETVPT